MLLASYAFGPVWRFSFAFWIGGPVSGWSDCGYSGSDGYYWVLGTFGRCMWNFGDCGYYLCWD